MSSLDNLSEQQLVKLITAKKMGADSNDKDYSSQYKRNIGDTLRDAAYGAVHAPWEVGKMGGNILTGGNLEKIPGYKQYIPFMEKAIESIKSPYPSPAGEAAKIAGEFIIPGAKGAKLSYSALKTAASKLPAITKKGMSKLYTLAEETAAEEGVKGLKFPPELIRQTEKFLKELKVPIGDRLKSAMAGEPSGAHEIKNVLGKLSRRLDYKSGEAVGAENLHADWVKAFMKAVEEGGFPKSHAAYSKAGEEFKRSQQLRAMLGEGAKHITGISALKALLGLTKHV